MKTKGPVNVPPIKDMTKSNLGTDSAITIAKIVKIVLRMHRL